MREIKFRGKILHGVLQGEWIYGYYVKHNEQVLIFPIFEEPGQYEQGSYEVDPKTVGQFIGLWTLAKDIEVFEGDILRCKLQSFQGQPLKRNEEVHKNYLVEWRSGANYGWGMRNGHNLRMINNHTLNNAKAEVVGNIFDNPELMDAPIEVVGRACDEPDFGEDE